MVSASILAACQAEDLSIGDAIRDCNILDISDDMGNGIPSCAGSADIERFDNDCWAEFSDHHYY